MKQQRFVTVLERVNNGAPARPQVQARVMRSGLHAAVADRLPCHMAQSADTKMMLAMCICM